MTKWVFIFLLVVPNFVFADVVKELSIGEVEEEFTVIDETFINTDDWAEPVFSKEDRKRGLASVFPKDFEVDDDLELPGQLQVVSEIPYSLPSEYRWSLKKRVLNSLRHKRRKKKKKTAKK